MSKFGYVFEPHGRYDRKTKTTSSLCSQCGKTKDKGFKRLWHHGSWFRGEDERLGIYCMECAAKFRKEHAEEMK